MLDHRIPKLLFPHLLDVVVLLVPVPALHTRTCLPTRLPSRKASTVPLQTITLLAWAPTLLLLLLFLLFLLLSFFSLLRLLYPILLPPLVLHFLISLLVVPVQPILAASTTTQCRITFPPHLEALTVGVLAPTVLAQASLASGLPLHPFILMLNASLAAMPNQAHLAGIFIART